MPDRFSTLDEAAAGLTAWLAETALPLWSSRGVETESGAFVEALTPEGDVHDPRRRTRVQARQAFVLASANQRGLAPDGLSAARRGFDLCLARARRADGLFMNALNDPGARLYEQAFVLLALAALAEAEPQGPHVAEALALRDRLAAYRHPRGGFREEGDEPFQANAQMHLLEAALAWEAVGGDAGWAALADEVATLALDRFIDPATGALREAYDETWNAFRGEAGAIEPGHQFEWAWLLSQWSAARGDGRAGGAVRGLYAAGRRGLNSSGVVVNRLWDDLSVRDGAGRLWPQTEFLRAAAAFGETQDALTAASTIRRFLQTPTPGIWRERMDAEGAFVEEPAPATSLYHLTTAILALQDAVRRQ